MEVIRDDGRILAPVLQRSPAFSSIDQSINRIGMTGAI